jgi:hypothetical protein
MRSLRRARRTAAVTAIASAPQNTTRIAAVHDRAPPTRAASHPSPPSSTSEVPPDHWEKRGLRADRHGDQRRRGPHREARGRGESGLQGARAKSVPDAELVARMTPQRIVRHQLSGHPLGQLRFQAPTDVDRRQLGELRVGVRCELALLRASGPRARCPPASSPKRTRQRPWTSRRRRGPPCPRPARSTRPREWRPLRGPGWPSTRSRRWRRGRQREASRRVRAVCFTVARSHRVSSSLPSHSDTTRDTQGGRRSGSEHGPQRQRKESKGPEEAAALRGALLSRPEREPAVGAQKRLPPRAIRRASAGAAAPAPSPCRHRRTPRAISQIGPAISNGANVNPKTRITGNDSRPTRHERRPRREIAPGVYDHRSARPSRCTS